MKHTSCRLVVAAILALSIAAIPSIASAYGWCGPGVNRFPPNPDKGGGGDSSSSCEETAGDPIQINYNGSQNHTFRDTLIRGAVLDFDLFRTYVSNVEAGADSPAIKETTLSGMFPFRSVTKMEPDGDNREYSANWKHSFQVYVSNFYDSYYDVVAETGKPYPFARRYCNPPDTPCNDDTAYKMDTADPLNMTNLFIVYKNERPMQFVWIKEDGKRYYFRSCYDYTREYRQELFEDVRDACDGLHPESARLDKIVAADGVHTMLLSYNLPGTAWNAEKGKYELVRSCNDWQLHQIVMDNGIPIVFDYGVCHAFTECLDSDGKLVACGSPGAQDPHVTEVPSLKAVRAAAGDVDIVKYDYEVVNYGSRILWENELLPWGHDLVLSKAQHFSNGNYTGTEIYDYQAPGFGVSETLAKDSGYMKTIGAARTVDGPEEVTVLSVEHASATNGYFGDASGHPDKFVRECRPDTEHYPLDEYFLYNCFIATGKDFRLYFDGGPREIYEVNAPVLIDL
ncbi:MAG: hypothetical protein PHR35_18200, partial [Kiritimatiellae bacterium]|nr:hypothetical protein [Kiritimatiellia bacterium]